MIISPKTARNHIEHIYAKIGVSNRAGASLFAVQHGLLSDQISGSELRSRKMGQSPHDSQPSQIFIVTSQAASQMERKEDADMGIRRKFFAATYDSQMAKS